jgi:hypothetical protein
MELEASQVRGIACEWIYFPREIVRWVVTRRRLRGLRNGCGGGSASGFRLCLECCGALMSGGFWLGGGDKHPTFKTCRRQ